MTPLSGKLLIHESWTAAEQPSNELPFLVLTMAANAAVAGVVVLVRRTRGRKRPRGLRAYASDY
eukprot:2303849-Lingulodinium_polyedra.AAC.1